MTRLLNGLERESEIEQKAQAAAIRKLLLTDLYALIWYGLRRRDIEHPWLYDRCREVQAEPNGYIDLWAREHYKSTIITQGLTTQEVLTDPELTFGIFSHTRGIAKGFLAQIMREFESNRRLIELFPDVLWDNPQKEARVWSMNDGIVVKRKTNPKEATIEAWGVTDGQPTSKHFSRLIFDDLVTKESVTTPEMIANVTASWELALSLGTQNGIRRYIGTRYHFNDSYRTMITRGAAKPRLYPATIDGKMEGEPVYMSRELLMQKRKEMGPYTFGCQMLQDPTADKAQGFDPEWINFYQDAHDGQGMNKYILVDAASEKKKGSDYTAIWVIGLSTDGNYYVLDMVRDRLKLTERADALFSLHRRWKPLGVGYEKYGMMADVEHIKDRQDRENYRFEIIELGGSMPKLDRIKRLVPLFEEGRIWFPHEIKKRDYEGQIRELVNLFIEEEYKAFPVGLHDDLLDALARITEEDLMIVWPEPEPKDEGRYALRASSRPRGSWVTV